MTTKPSSGLTLWMKEISTCCAAIFTLRLHLWSKVVTASFWIEIGIETETCYSSCTWNCASTVGSFVCQCNIPYWLQNGDYSASHSLIHCTNVDSRPMRLRATKTKKAQKTINVVTIPVTVVHEIAAMHAVRIMHTVKRSIPCIETFCAFIVRWKGMRVPQGLD